MIETYGTEVGTEKQVQLLSQIIEAKITFQTLTIRHCAALTNSILLMLLKESKGLTRLVLMDCPEITEELSIYLEKHTQDIEVLVLRQLPNITWVGKLKDSIEYSQINLPQLKVIDISNNLQLHTIAIHSSVQIQAIFQHNAMLTQLILPFDKIKQVDMQGCRALTDNSLLTALEKSPVLPRLNLENCPQVTAELWQCLHHINQQATWGYPKWDIAKWQTQVLGLTLYIGTAVNHIEGASLVDEQHLMLISGLLANNLKLLTLLVTFSPDSGVVSFDPLLKLLELNQSLTSLCIVGMPLAYNDADRILKTIERVPKLKTLALAVEDSHSIILMLCCRFGTLIRERDIIINGVKVMPEWQSAALARAEPLAISADEVASQAMLIDVLGAAIQNADCLISEEATNILALLSGAKRLTKWAAHVAKLLSGQIPRSLVLGRTESVMLSEQQAQDEDCSSSSSSGGASSSSTDFASSSSSSTSSSSNSGNISPVLPHHTEFGMYSGPSSMGPTSCNDPDAFGEFGDLKQPRTLSSVNLTSLSIN